ncbi:hypothetical protein HJC23_004623 [Cyclotella cryptica]|uniref:Uncharacterized protein n=1 Tax=Cyclotella cryptica TaxID=29204 RepID=A0ABD3QF66_9STRA|eukprot:CCRYP_005940-RA/>CCRYP_005940-RA protein AED:0.00 eAED:0.00 QI:238/-1/1/1/-1/1/1/223/466
MALTTTSDGSTAPVTFQTDAARSTITAEQLSLIGFASRLGACVNNDDTGSKKAKSVRDEAMLLMSLLMGKKASDILSEEIGVKDEDECNEKEDFKPKDRTVDNFSFTFPALSLQPSHSNDEPCTTPNGTTELPSPSELLARTHSVNDKDAVRDSSEAMAHNVLESFGAALVWRAKTWVNSLASVLALKVRSEGDCASRSDPPKVDRGDYNEGQAGPNFDADELMNSREMQIIDSIVRSSEEVSVVNVKTSFRVLPQRIEDPTEPDSKKRKTECKALKTYKVIHKLVFEAIVSMTSNEGDRYKKVKLQAPGVIEGTFLAENNSEVGEDFLCGVSIKLDTNALALSLERESRSVVRRAAEAALLAASGMEITDVAHVHHSIISPRHVLMSPIQQHDGSDQETEEQISMSTFSTSVPSHVSAEDGGCSDSSAATTPSFTPANTPRASSIFQSPSPAPLESSNLKLHGGT